MKKCCIFCVVFGILILLGGCSRHTPDTNGKNNFSLTSISLQDIITGNSCVKSGATRVRKNNVTDIHVRKFSGVETVQTFQLNGAALELSIGVNVESGNLKVLVCNEHEILKEIFVNEGVQTVNLPPMSDTVYLKVGGESAEYKMSFEYEVSKSLGIMI